MCIALHAYTAGPLGSGPCRPPGAGHRVLLSPGCVHSPRLSTRARTGISWNQQPASLLPKSVPQRCPCLPRTPFQWGCWYSRVENGLGRFPERSPLFPDASPRSVFSFSAPGFIHDVPLAREIAHHPPSLCCLPQVCAAQDTHPPWPRVPA